VTEVNSVVARLRGEADLAESGDKAAIETLRHDLWSLSYTDRKAVADSMQSTVLPTVFGGTTVERDVLGNPRSMTFQPSMFSRLGAWFGGSPEHAVRVTSSVIENYNASDSMYKNLRRQYEKLSMPVRQLLLDQHYVIGLGKTLVDADPDLKNSYNLVQLRSFSSLALSQEHRILMSDLVQTGDGVQTPNPLPQRMMRYQIGLIVNEALEKPSDSDLLKTAFAADLASAEPHARKRMVDFLESKNDGYKPIFGQEFNLIFRDNNNEIVSQEEKDASRYLRRTQQVVLQAVGKYLEPDRTKKLADLDSVFISRPDPDLSNPLTQAAWRVEGEITDAETTGSQERLNSAGNELYQLSWQDRKTVTNTLEEDLGDKVKVVRDVIGNVRDIQFTAPDEGAKWNSVRTPMPLVENYNTTDAFYQRVTNAADALPPKIKALLLDNYWVIGASSTILEGAPGIKDCEVPCNEAAGLALWDEKRIILPKAAELKGGKGYFEPYYVEEDTRHEVGHAVDKILGLFSHSDKFLTPYREESAAKMPEEVRKDLQYYLQTDWNGPQEMWAEMFSDISRAPSDRFPNSHNHELLEKYFPKTRQAIIDLLGDYLKR